MNPGAGNQYFPYEMGQQYPQYPPGWIYPLPSTYNFNDRGTPSPSPSTASSGSLSESFPFVEDGSMPESSQTSSRRTSSENKKAQERWTKDEEKLLVQLWAEKHDLLESREWRSQHGVMFCSQILFSSATVAFRTNFLSLADFKSDLSWTNLKLSSSATWPFPSKGNRESAQVKKI